MTKTTWSTKHIKTLKRNIILKEILAFVTPCIIFKKETQILCLFDSQRRWSLLQHAAPPESNILHLPSSQRTNSVSNNWLWFCNHQSVNGLHGPVCCFPAERLEARRDQLWLFYERAGWVFLFKFDECFRVLLLSMEIWKLFFFFSIYPFVFLWFSFCLSVSDYNILFLCCT